MARLPPGYRFIPTNEELIVHYLLNKVQNLPLPSDFVVERDLYGTLPPWDLLRDDTDPWQTTPVKNAEGLHTGILDRTIYVLTKLKKASRNRISRSAGCGVWHGDGVNRPILDDKGTLIGTSRSFVFKVTEKIQDRMGHWIMHEVALPKEHECFEQQYVICKITRDDSKPLKICPKRPRPSSSGEEAEEQEEEEENNKNCRKKQKQHDNNNGYKHHLSAAAQVVPENSNTSDQDFFNGLHEMMNLPPNIADGWMFGIRDENVSSVQQDSFLLTSDDQISHSYCNVNDLDYILSAETSGNNTRICSFALNDMFQNPRGLSSTEYNPTLRDASSNCNVHEGTCNTEDFPTSENDAALEQQQWLNIAEDQPMEAASNSHVPNPVMNLPLEGSEIMEMPPATEEDEAAQGGTAIVQHEEDPWGEIWNTEDFRTSENDGAFEQQQQHWLNIAENQPSDLIYMEYNPTMQATSSNYNLQEGTCNTEYFCTSGNNAPFEQQQQHYLNIAEDQPLEAASNSHVPNHVMNQPLEGSGIMEMPRATAEDEATHGGTAVVQHEEDPWDDFWIS